MSGGNGVPGPGQDTVEPSPIDHRTKLGEAVAVTEAPGTEAVAVWGCHCPRSSHSHVGN
ncbi:hypothetical protein [Saccharopolyspora sp. SCSIO 74807]|uniref:hypothetical protein n=1 Tax=Saccharopolyspora sp. SCSIO 74807 TaxID=3118084 RepID=UPI0030CF54A6